MAENGCKWRALPREFGNWNTIYVRLNRWAKRGVLDRVFEAQQRERLINIKIEVASLDSTIIKVHPDGTGALKKTGLNLSASPEADGQPKFIWLPRMPTPR
jgi:transposase